MNSVYNNTKNTALVMMICPLGLSPIVEDVSQLWDRRSCILGGSGRYRFILRLQAPSDYIGHWFQFKPFAEFGVLC